MIRTATRWTPAVPAIHTSVPSHHVARETHLPLDADALSVVRTSAHTVIADFPRNVHIFIAFTTNYEKPAAAAGRNS